MQTLKYNTACASVVVGMLLGVAALAGLLQAISGATPWYLRVAGEPPSISAAADPASIINPHRYTNESWSPPRSQLKPREYRIETPYREARHYRTLITKLTLHQGGQIDSRRSRATPHMSGHHRVAIYTTAATNEDLKKLSQIPASDAKAHYQWATSIPGEPTADKQEALMPVDVYIEGQRTPTVSSENAIAVGGILAGAVCMAIGGAIASVRMDARRRANAEPAAAAN